nr:uncharacterized protein LOC128702742 [Cherax quadricarinatus]
MVEDKKESDVVVVGADGGVCRSPVLHTFSITTPTPTATTTATTATTTTTPTSNTSTTTSNIHHSRLTTTTTSNTSTTTSNIHHSRLTTTRDTNKHQHSSGNWSSKTSSEIITEERVGPDAQGNYNFIFESSDGISRKEQGAPQGEWGAVATQGEWSFTFPDGTPAHFSFVADGNGFNVQSDQLPVGPPMPAHAIAQIEAARLEDEAAAASSDTSQAVVVSPTFSQPPAAAFPDIRQVAAVSPVVSQAVAVSPTFDQLPDIAVLDIRQAAAASSATSQAATVSPVASQPVPAPSSIYRAP